MNQEKSKSIITQMLGGINKIINMKSLTTHYSDSEIKSIKNNLKSAFGQDYLSVYIKVKDLYIKKDKILIHNKSNYYVYFPTYVEEFGKKKGWYEITITYKRTGVLFFKFINESKEFFFIEDSSFANDLTPAVINLREFNIPDSNLDIIKFEKGKVPFDVKVIKNNGESFII